MAEQSEVRKDLQVVVFHLGGEEYGADISQIREIIRVGEITTIPQAPIDITGMINLRGHITTVVNLRKRLGMEERRVDGSSRIVIVEVEGKTVGLMVDNVSEVKHIKGSQVDPVNQVLVANPDQSYIQGICKLKSSLLILVDLKKVIGADNENGHRDTAVV